MLSARESPATDRLDRKSRKTHSRCDSDEDDRGQSSGLISEEVVETDQPLYVSSPRTLDFFTILGKNSS